jgi:1D-myo-inositol-tetrakisphosphate 5-kinase/inositol-polyphosphate multikinase
LKSSVCSATMLDSPRSASSPTRRFEHQIGGYSHKDNRCQQILKCEDDRTCILKPLQHDERGKTELEFYRRVQHLNHIKSFVPEFLGVVTVDQGGDANEVQLNDESELKQYEDVQLYLRLRDLTEGFVKPCIADIKIGKQSYDSQANADKVQREKEKYPFQEAVGFRIIGYKVYDHQKKEYRDKRKEFGRKLTPEGILPALEDFFSGVADLEHRKAMLGKILSRIDQIVEMIETQKDFDFWATSILIVYEADEVQSSSPDFVVSMIDFAHALPMQDPKHIDENYLYGINNFRSLIKAIHQ